MCSAAKQPNIYLQHDGHEKDSKYNAKMGMGLRTSWLQHSVSLLGKEAGGRDSERILDTHVHKVA